MKRLRMLALIFLLVATTTGCTQNVALHQSKSEIVQIDLVYSPFMENEVLHTLTEEETEPFLDALLKLKTHKHLSPQDIGGGLFVRIMYADGSAEILGSWSVGYESNGVLEHDGWYYISHDDLYDLFSEYVDLSAYFTN